MFLREKNQFMSDDKNYISLNDLPDSTDLSSVFFRQTGTQTLHAYTTLKAAGVKIPPKTC